MVGTSWRPLEGPLRLTAIVYVRLPASVPKRARETARPTCRPDLDNYLKTVLDGASVLWRDDAQVVEILAAKRYAVDTPPRWELIVESLKPAAT